MKRAFVFGMVQLVLVLLARAAPGDISEQSQEDVLKQFSYRVVSPPPKEPKIATNTPEDELDSVVRLDAFQVDEDRDQKRLSTWVKDTEDRIKTEKFNWKDGGLISRRVGKRMTIETGIWPDDRGVGIKVLNFKW